MKRTKKFLILAPVFGLFLSGCTFQEGLTTTKDWASNNILDPVKNWFDGITGKKQEEKSVDQTPSGEDTPSGGGQQSTVSFEDIVSRIKPIAASLLDKSQSDLVSEDYEEASEESTADYFTYNKEGLMFADFPYEAEDENETYVSLYEKFVSQLPSGATVDSTKETHYEDYFYDVSYKVDDYYYCIYACDYYGLGLYIYGSIDIVPQSQYDAYYELIYDNEEEEEEEEQQGDLPAVVQAINEALDDTLTYDSDNGTYAKAYNVGESGVTYSDTKADESVLKPAADVLVSYLPESLGDPTYKFYTTADDYWGDGSGDTVAEYTYSEITGDTGSVVVVGYVYKDCLVAQITYFPGN